MIPSTLVEVPFASGVDQKSAPEWVATGAQTSVLNGRWSKTGAMKKRFGSTAISKTSRRIGTGSNLTLTNGGAVEAYRGGHVLSDGSRLFSYSPTKGQLLYQDQLPECIATRHGLSQDTTGLVESDVAVAGGFACVVYRATTLSGAVWNYAVLVDLSTMSQVGEPWILDKTSTKNGLRVIAVGTTFHVFWTASSGAIHANSLDASTLGNLTWQDSGAIISDVNASAISWAFDVAHVSGTSQFLIAYQNNDVSNKVIKVLLYNSAIPIAAAVASTTFTWGGTGVSPMVCCAIRATSGETAWLAYGTTDGGTNTFVRTIGLNPATLAVTTSDTAMWTFTANSQQLIGVARYNATTAIVIAGGGATPSCTWRGINGSGALAQGSQYNYSPWSKPTEITMPGQTAPQIFVMMAKSDANGAATYQFVDLNVNSSGANGLARPVATVAPRETTAGIVNGSVAASVAATGDGRYLIPIWVDVSVSREGVSLAAMDFTSPARHQSVELGDSLYVAGGVPSIFDGSQVTEYGFLHAPSFGSVSVAAGGSVDVGSHQYAIVYKWVNARGELQRSQPIFSAQIATTAGNQLVNVPIQPYTMTTKQDSGNGFSPPVLFDLYRNTIADPATFWQIYTDTSESSNDPRGTTTVTVQDNISDSSMTSAANGTLYTGGNVLADQCPPSLTCLCVHKSRLFGVGDDGLTLWFTKQYTTGFTPGFNDSLTLVVPEDGGTITGLASLDDHLVVFKRDRVFALYGTGPDVTGSNSDFSDFVRIPSPVGCTQSRSVVVTSAGVFFLSDQGIYLLTRGGEATYVGRAVEDTVAANPICTASDVVAPLGEIRWCLAPSLTSATGVVIAYDYIQDKWGLHKYYDVDKAQSNTFVAGARAANGTWAWLSPGGQLNVESTTSHLDGGTQWVPLQVESAWIKAQGIGGWARFRRLFAEMEQSTAFQLTIDAATDYNTTYTQTQTWTDTQIAARSTTLPELDLQLANQKTQAVRFRLTDAAPAVNPVGTGEGPVFLGMNLEVAAMRGGKGTRLPAGQRG